MKLLKGCRLGPEKVNPNILKTLFRRLFVVFLGIYWVKPENSRRINIFSFRR
jgi:hypothetical protein